MIPKIVHYCWFGGNPLPASALRCIASWRKFLPDYEIREWNESNFDVRAVPYVREAYEAGKYAFVSDYARFRVLYEHGGLYFDTDVEVVRPLDEVLAQGPFMGCEHDSGGPYPIAVNPGLGLAATPGMAFYARMLEHYAATPFLGPDGMPYPVTVVTHTTRELRACGLSEVPGIQEVAGIRIYPKCYFNPFDDATGRLRMTPQTRSIHWYAKTWVDLPPLRMRLSRLAHRMFGVAFSQRVRRFFDFKS